MRFAGRMPRIDAEIVRVGPMPTKALIGSTRSHLTMHHQNDKLLS